MKLQNIRNKLKGKSINMSFNKYYWDNSSRYPQYKLQMTPTSSHHFCSCPLANNNKIINLLLGICYGEWVIMGILLILILANITVMKDIELVWFVIYSGILLIFILPLIVGLHEHTTGHTEPSCSCDVQESSEDKHLEEEETSIEAESESELIFQTIVELLML